MNGKEKMSKTKKKITKQHKTFGGLGVIPEIPRPCFNKHTQTSPAPGYDLWAYTNTFIIGGRHLRHARTSKRTRGIISRRSFSLQTPEPFPLLSFASPTLTCKQINLAKQTPPFLSLFHPYQLLPLAVFPLQANPLVFIKNTAISIIR